jgi:hypothetical protein
VEKAFLNLALTHTLCFLPTVYLRLLITTQTCVHFAQAFHSETNVFQFLNLVPFTSGLKMHLIVYLLFPKHLGNLVLLMCLLYLFIVLMCNITA